MVHLEEQDPVTPFLDAGLPPRNHHADVFVSKSEVLCICNMLWKAESMKQLFHFWMFAEEDAVKEACRPGEKMSYQGTKDLYFTRRRSELVGAGYDIKECFAEWYRFPKKLLEGAMASCKLQKNFAACVHNVGNFHATWESGSEVGFYSYASRSGLQLGDSRSV